MATLAAVAPAWSHIHQPFNQFQPHKRRRLETDVLDQFEAGYSKRLCTHEPLHHSRSIVLPTARARVPSSLRPMVFAAHPPKPLRAVPPSASIWTPGFKHQSAFVGLGQGGAASLASPGGVSWMAPAAAAVHEPTTAAPTPVPPTPPTSASASLRASTTAFVASPPATAAAGPTRPPPHRSSFNDFLQRFKAKVDQSVKRAMDMFAHSEQLASEAAAARKREAIATRLREANLVTAAIDSARAARPSLLARCKELKRQVARCDETMSTLEALVVEAADSVDTMVATLDADAPARTLRSDAQSLRTTLEDVIPEADEALASAEEASAHAMALTEEVQSTYWASADEHKADLVRQERVDDYAEIAPLVASCGPLAQATADRVTTLRELRSRLEALLTTLDDVLERSPEIVGTNTSAPPGSSHYSCPPLTSEEEELVDNALAPGPLTQQLAEFEGIPVLRKDMATLRPGAWLNDEVINYFLKLLEAREKSKVASGAAATAGDGPPRCHFAQTGFYTKLAEGPGGYDYTRVRRWTKKVDVFSKDFIVVPIHCHGNHWTLALINFRWKRFEYIDSMRGSEGAVLRNLRRWLEDESKDKKKVTLDTSAWMEVTWKAGTPLQCNGFDCGVFMTRTADWLARDAVLDFNQSQMEYFRRRTVLEIMQQQLMP